MLSDYLYVVLVEFQQGVFEKRGFDGWQMFSHGVREGLRSDVHTA